MSLRLFVIPNDAKTLVAVNRGRDRTRHGVARRARRAALLGMTSSVDCRWKAVS